MKPDIFSILSKLESQDEPTAEEWAYMTQYAFEHPQMAERILRVLQENAAHEMKPGQLIDLDRDESIGDSK